MTAHTSAPLGSTTPGSRERTQSGTKVASRIAPHSVERAARRALLAEPTFHFSTLVVRRINGGVCLEGVMDVEDGTSPDVAGLLQRIDGINNVVNHLVRRCIARKG